MSDYNSEAVGTFLTGKTIKAVEPSSCAFGVTLTFMDGSTFIIEPESSHDLCGMQYEMVTAAGKKSIAGLNT